MLKKNKYLTKRQQLPLSVGESLGFPFRYSGVAAEVPATLKFLNVCLLTESRREDIYKIWFQIDLYT